VKGLRIAVLMLFMFGSYTVNAALHQGKVGVVNNYGTEWGGSWPGSILFKLNTMPAGVSYFTMKKSDVAFQTFVSALLGAKFSQAEVLIEYDPAKIDGNGYVAVRVIVLK